MSKWRGNERVLGETPNDRTRTLLTSMALASPPISGKLLSNLALSSSASSPVPSWPVTLKSLFAGVGASNEGKLDMGSSSESLAVLLVAGSTGAGLDC